MKKVFICLCVVLVFVLLVGCETFGGYSSSSSYTSSSSSSYTSSSSSSSKSETSSKNTYHSSTYSSKYSKEPLTKDGIMVIYMNNKNYQFQRPFELGLKEEFEKKGLKVEVLSDYYITDDNFISTILSFDPDYYLEVVVEGSVYTYEYGGGISDIGFEVLVYGMKPYHFDEIMKISTSLDGTKNNKEGLNSSMETISKISSKEIVEEFCKYL